MIPLHQWLSRPAPADQAMTAEGAQAPPIGGSDVPLAADTELRIQEAYEKGRAEGNDLTQQLLKAAIDAEWKRHAEALAMARRQWVDVEAPLLKQGLEAAHQRLVQQIGDLLGAALQGLLEEKAVAQAVAAFRGKLEALAADHPLIRVEAADDLAAKLTSAGLPPGVEVVATARTSLRAVAGDTEIESNLEAWLAAIRGERP